MKKSPNFKLRFRISIVILNFIIFHPYTFMASLPNHAGIHAIKHLKKFVTFVRWYEKKFQN